MTYGEPYRWAIDQMYDIFDSGIPPPVTLVPPNRIASSRPSFYPGGPPLSPIRASSPRSSSPRASSPRASSPRASSPRVSRPISPRSFYY